MVTDERDDMAYGMPNRLTWPPSPLWVVPVCIAVLIAATLLRLNQ